MTDETTVTGTATDNPTPAADAAPVETEKAAPKPEADAKDPPEAAQADGGEDKSEGEEGEQETPAKPKRPSAKERIDDLTGKWRAAEREKQAKEQEIRKLQERLAKYDTPPPRRDEFDDPDEFTAALAEHRFAQRTKQEKQADIDDRKAEVEATRKEADETLALAFNERIEEFVAQAPDYWDVVDKTLPISDATARELMQSELGPQVAYWLGKNRAEAARLARVTDPIEVARAVARVEARLTASPPRRTTQAPAPVSSIARGAGTTPAFDPEKASMEEYVAWRKKSGG